MTGKDDQNAGGEPTAADPLSAWQRLAAGAIGAVSAGAGGASVFLTSNQAGSVALLAVGAGFLIMGVSGMPILGAKLKDIELTMATRRREVLAQVELEAPEEASLALDVLQQIDPGARKDPVVVSLRRLLWEQEAFNALSRSVVGSAVQIGSPSRNPIVDGILALYEDEVDIDLRATYSPESTILRPSFIEKIYLDAQASGRKRLVITNMRLPNEVAEVADGFPGIIKQVQIARWLDRQDDYALTLAANRLLGLRE